MTAPCIQTSPPRPPEGSGSAPPPRARSRTVGLRIGLLVVVALILSPSAIEAQPKTATRKQATAVRVADGSVHLDGRLDDRAWREARFFADFLQKQPTEGAEPTDRTEVAIVYDDVALYVGARMYSRDTAAIQAPLSRRDNTGQAEHIWVSLDTYLDRRTAYSFGVSASGVRMDFYHPRDHETDVDMSFDPVWEAEARIDSLGWTAELRIPFSQLRFSANRVQRWGFNMDRWIPSRNEDVFWVYVPQNETGWSSYFGDLVGIEGIRPTRRIELLPYIATSARLTGQRDLANPFDNGTNLNARFGGDVKMGLGPNLTLSATINPDFGQVEADPADVNLSAFETTFDEKRPFFTEGSQVFAGTRASYFYSRRIGGTPRGPAVGDYVERPEASTILGAAKLSGRLPGGLTVGALAAVTDREHARTFDRALDVFRDTLVAPRTMYGVVRALQEFGPSASTAGLMLTAVHRALDDTHPLTTLLTQRAVSGGADWNLRFANGTYQLTGGVGFSHVMGDSAAITRVQSSSARYFQRPDAPHVRLDSSRTALSGGSASLGFEKVSGRHWLWELGAVAESPGFELNDAGRLNDTDGVGTFASLRYRETRPGRRYRRYSVALAADNGWNFGAFEDGLFNGRSRQGSSMTLDSDITWPNFWRTTFTTFLDFRGQSQSLTRGGPSMGTGQGWATIASLSNNFASTTIWQARVYYGEAEFGSLTYRVSGHFAIRPSPQWELSVTPNYLRVTDPRQFVAQRGGGSPATFGGRYVFGTIERGTFLTALRANYAFTPDLSFELYAEPFAASGRYTAFGELAGARDRALSPLAVDRSTPGTITLTNGLGPVTIENPDFNVRSFRSNAVLRWEWQPGSTLFLVWQQDRGRETGIGDLIRPGDLFDGFGAGGESFLAIKASYWIPVR